MNWKRELERERERDGAKEEKEKGGRRSSLVVQEDLSRLLDIENVGILLLRKLLG